MIGHVLLLVIILQFRLCSFSTNDFEPTNRLTVTPTIDINTDDVFPQLPANHLINEVNEHTSSDMYAVFYPQFQRGPKRTKRSSTADVLLFEESYTMDLFGKTTTLFLNHTNVTSQNFRTRGSQINQSDLQCHYQGFAKACLDSVCEMGMAAVSNCGFGLQGYLHFTGTPNDTTIFIRSLGGNASSVNGPHLAQRILTLGDVGGVNNSMTNSSQVVPDIGAEYNIVKQRSSVDALDTSNDAPKPETIFEGRTVILSVAVFVDGSLLNRLKQTLTTVGDRTNMILATFNAVQKLFADPSFGRYRIRIEVSQIIFDTEGKVFPGNGEATKYLFDMCRNYQYTDLWPADEPGPKWNILIGLTDIDIHGYPSDLRRDSTYAKFHDLPADRRIYGVTGLAYSGYACESGLNCVLVEFNGMESVETIAHEIGHTIGMTHDGNGNSCPEKSNRIMSVDSGKPRHGWSACSAQSFQEFLLDRRRSFCFRTDATRPEDFVTTQSTGSHTPRTAHVGFLTLYFCCIPMFIDVFRITG